MHDEQSHGLDEFSNESGASAASRPVADPVASIFVSEAHVPVAQEIAPLPSVLDELIDAELPAEPSDASLRVLYSPALVPILVVVAVIGYGGFTLLWWERDRPQFGVSLSSTPVSLPPLRLAPSQVAMAPPAAPLVQPRPQSLVQPPPLQPEPPSRVQTQTAQSQTQPKAPIVVAPPAAALTAKDAAPRATRRDDVVPAVVRAPVPPRRTEQNAALPAVSRSERLTAPAVLPEPVESLRPSPPPVALPATPVAAAAAPEAAVVAPPRLAEPNTVERVVTDRDAIGNVLQSYRAAYNSLDATSASSIWQGVDTRALQRAFATLTRQDVSFDRCEVRVTTANRAVAACRGVLLYVPKVGDGNPQERRLSWNFDFTRAADRWMISSVSAK